MLKTEDWEQLSPEAKEYYDENREYYDGMARKWDTFVSMPVVIETDCKKKTKLPKTYEDDGREPN